MTLTVTGLLLTLLLDLHLFSKWNFDVAESNFRKAITLEPDHIDARIGLGVTLYRGISEHDRMIHHFKAGH